MDYSIRQHLNGRWGIYKGLNLLATIGCYQTCQEILSYLKNESNSRQPERIDLLRISSRPNRNIKQSA